MWRRRLLQCDGIRAVQQQERHSLDGHTHSELSVGVPLQLLRARQHCQLTEVR